MSGKAFSGSGGLWSGELDEVRQYSAGSPDRLRYRNPRFALIGGRTGRDAPCYSVVSLC